MASNSEANDILKGVAEKIFSGARPSNGFALDISKWASQTTADIVLVVRKTSIDMFSRIILRSPVDTGRFRNNWYTTIGAPSSKKTEDVDKSGAGSIAEAKSVVSTYKMGDTIWMTNNLPYAWRLEMGWSRQAPAGMVGITVTEFQSIFDKAAKSTKSFA